MSDTLGEAGADGNVPNSAEISVFSVGKSLKIEPFKIPENPWEIGRAWKEWMEDLEGLCECPEDLWRQRNQEICTQLTRYSAGGRR